MKLTTNVKAKTGLWKFLPKIISTKTAQCVYPFIFLPEHIYKDLISRTPKPESIAVLLHEKVHLERQKRKGIFFVAFYILFLQNFALTKNYWLLKNK